MDRAAPINSRARQGGFRALLPIPPKCSISVWRAMPRSRSAGLWSRHVRETKAPWRRCTVNTMIACIAMSSTGWARLRPPRMCRVRSSWPWCGVTSIRVAGTPLRGLAVCHRSEAGGVSLRRHARADSVDLNEALHLVADTAGPETGAEEREQRVALAQALRQLPDTQREVIILRYVLSLSLAETAAALERSEGAIKQLQLRALAGLRGILAGPTGPFA